MSPRTRASLPSRLVLAVLLFAFAALPSDRSRAADLVTLYNFCSQANCTDGENPAAGLTADAKGDLLGTTSGGGANGKGTVFEIAKTKTGFAPTPKILLSFDGADGSTPMASLLLGPGGDLFGTTADGGANGSGGTVFEIAKTHSGYAKTPTILYSFCAHPDCADGSSPMAGLVADKDGNLFGTTQLGGANDQGEVFEIVKTDRGYARSPTILYSFCSQASCTDGSQPTASLLLGPGGDLFGTTQLGGAASEGEVFEIAKTHSGYASTATLLYSFCSELNCADGSSPAAGLVLDQDGDLFGTTYYGGTFGNGNGTVFEIVKTAVGYLNTASIIASFDPEVNGANPAAPLLVDASGDLFGTASAGALGAGTVFEIAKSGDSYGAPAVLVAFSTSEGATPVGGLIADRQGDLFGTTESGGANNNGLSGTVFAIPASQ